MKRIRISCQLSEEATELFMQYKAGFQGFSLSDSQTASRLIEEALDNDREQKMQAKFDRKAKR